MYSQGQRTLLSDQWTRKLEDFFLFLSLFFFFNLKGLWLLSELDLHMSYHQNQKTIVVGGSMTKNSFPIR